MQQNEQLANYLLWLKDRGINLPVYVDGKPAAIADATADTSVKILFVGDGASPLNANEQGSMPTSEQQLLQNIVKALKLSSGDFHYLSFRQRESLVQSIGDLKPAGVVILGGQALNMVSGKNLDFNTLRGKVWTPELYGIPTVVTYHLRDMLKNPDSKSLVWTDLNRLKDAIDKEHTLS